MDATKPDAFGPLKSALKDRQSVVRVFYLATAPDLFGPTAANLGRNELVTPVSRLVLEKPLGKDLASSRAINEAVGEVFAERQIYRIDHYLGKETVQNLMVLRFANSLFEPLWNRTHIDHVQITVAETVGVGGRWSYYDASGALRDMVQNHLLQVLCLTAMEPPITLDADSVRDEKVKVLKSLNTLSGQEAANATVRGQYRAGAIEGQPVPGYLDETDAKDSSNRETYVAIRAEIDNWRWAGVPFYLRTGKRLPQRCSEIVVAVQDAAAFHLSDLWRDAAVQPPDHAPAAERGRAVPDAEQAAGPGRIAPGADRAQPQLSPIPSAASSRTRTSACSWM